MRTRGAFAAALLMVASVVACGSSNDAGDSSPSAAVTGTPLPVERLDVTFVDTSRETPRSGEVAAEPERTLNSVVRVPRGEGPYPLLVFSHGLGATPGSYSAIIDRIASEGFVVVAPTFPLTNEAAPSGPDPGDTPNQPGDVSFIIDEVMSAVSEGSAPFADTVDPERVGTLGHSNGGITTLGVSANSCCRDDRVDAAVVLAGNPIPYNGGEYTFSETPPILNVHGTADALVPFEEAVRVFNELTGPKGLLTLQDADHSSWLRSADPMFEGVATTIVGFLRSYILEDDQSLRRLEGPDFLAAGMELHFADDGASKTLPTVAPPTDRRASADPTTGLTNGQVVSVSWENFTPGKVVNIVQCSGGGTGGNDLCDLTKAKILQPNPTGAGTLPLEIIVGAVGSGRCDASTTDCVIVVNDGGLQDPAATIRIPITLAG